MNDQTQQEMPVEAKEAAGNGVVSRYRNVIDRVLSEVRPYSMVPDHGIAKTIELTLAAIDAGILGDLVECGTWKGGCSFAMLLAQRYAYGSIIKSTWLYDSFQGMPEPHEIDGNHARGWLKHCEDFPDDPGHFEKCVASLETVIEGLLHFKLVPHVELIPGWFAKTIPQRKPEQIAVLRVDCDWYEPCKLVLQHMAPLVSVGGAIIMDDYMAWEGCAIATHEYLAEHKLPWRIKTISDLAGAYMTKEKDWW